MPLMLPFGPHKQPLGRLNQASVSNGIQVVFRGDWNVYDPLGSGARALIYDALQGSISQSQRDFLPFLEFSRACRCKEHARSALVDDMNGKCKLIAVNQNGAATDSASGYI